MKTNRINVRVLSSLLAATAGFAIATASVAAHAEVGVPTQMEFGTINSTVTLMLQVQSVNLRAQLASPCSTVPANTVDTLKMWHSMATAAVLAGKSVSVYATSCNGNRYITDIVLTK